MICCTHDGQHATNVLESCTLVVAVVYAWGHTIVGPMLYSMLVLFCSHHVVAGGGRHVKFGSTLRPYPGSFRAIQGAWAPQIMDEQAAGAENAVVTGSHEVVRDIVVDAIFPGAIDLGVKNPEDWHCGGTTSHYKDIVDAQLLVILLRCDEGSNSETEHRLTEKGAEPRLVSIIRKVTWDICRMLVVAAVSAGIFQQLLL